MTFRLSARLFAIGLAALASMRSADAGPADGDLVAWIDSTCEALWAEAGTKPEPIDDATFLRRVSLDLTGAIPSVAALRDFIDDPSPDKRSRVVDKLIAEDRSAEHLARVWRRTIVPRNPAGEAAGAQLEPWLKGRFAENVPFDDIARRLVTGTYEGDQAAAAAYRQAAGGGPADAADATSRIFLGVRIGCARCHDHPFTSWKQGDFWGLAAFFVDGAAPGGTPVIAGDDGRPYEARFLGETSNAEIPGDRTPRDVFAEWMTGADNPYFAAAAANRVWEQLVGRGLVVPVEDLDQAAEEERAELLDGLAERFAASGHDLRTLIAAVCKTRAYQSAGLADGRAARPLKVLSPEQVFDSLEQALALPVAKADETSARHNGQRTAFVARLDEAAGRSPEDFQAGVPQALMMMNGRLTAAAVDLEESRTLRAVVEAPFLDARQKIETLYLAALTREPTPSELRVMLGYVEGKPEADRPRAYAEIFWALLNSPEFVLSR